MTGRRPRTPAVRRLTEVELELMTHLWRLGGGTVNDVIGRLPSGRTLAYTSVSTILRILEKKGIVTSRKQGRGHVYVPRIGKEEYESWSVRDLVARVFEGAPAELVRCLLDSRTMTAAEIASIRSLLRERAADSPTPAGGRAGAGPSHARTDPAANPRRRS